MTNLLKTYTTLFLVLITFSTTKLNAQYYQLTDQVFIDYLKIVNPVLVDEQDRLIIANAENESITTMILSNRGLTNIDGIQYFKNTQNIDLSYNLIDSIPNLNILAQLKTLNVSHNNLKKFNAVPISKSLEELNISYNNIETFPDFHIDIALHDVYANNNLFTKITNFTKANQLTRLDIQNNNITVLQEFTSDDFPMLNTLNIEGNRLYFEDQATLPSSVINKDKQQVFHLGFTDTTLYVGDTLKIDMGHDLHPKNFNVLIQLPEQFEVADDNFTSIVSYVLEDTSYSGEYFVWTINNDYGSLMFQTNSFRVNVLKERPIIPEPPIITPPIEPGDTNEPDLNFGNYQKELIPDGTLDEQTIYLKGDGEAVIFDRSGIIYNRFQLPNEWDGRNLQGRIEPGYYLIKLNNSEVIKITIIY